MQIALGKRDHLIGATNAGEHQGVGWPISDFLAFIFKNDWKCTVSEFFGIKKNRYKTTQSMKNSVFKFEKCGFCRKSHRKKRRAPPPSSRLCRFFVTENIKEIYGSEWISAQSRATINIARLMSRTCHYIWWGIVYFIPCGHERRRGPLPGRRPADVGEASARSAQLENCKKCRFLKKFSPAGHGRGRGGPLHPLTV